MSISIQEATSDSQKLREWLGYAVDTGASDLHLVVGYPPVIRLHGELNEMAEAPLSPDEAEPMLLSLCSSDARARLEAEKSVDFSFSLVLGGKMQRFRANLFRASRQIGACLRVVPNTIPSFDWAGFPMNVAQQLIAQRDGLVIMTGATGTGKTTSLAMIVNLLVMFLAQRPQTLTASPA